MISGHRLCTSDWIDRTVFSCSCGLWLEIVYVRIHEQDHDEEMRAMKRVWIQHARAA